MSIFNRGIPNRQPPNRPPHESCFLGVRLSKTCGGTLVAQISTKHGHATVCELPDGDIFFGAALWAGQSEIREIHHAKQGPYNRTSLQQPLSLFVNNTPNQHSNPESEPFGADLHSEHYKGIQK